MSVFPLLSSHVGVTAIPGSTLATPTSATTPTWATTPTCFPTSSSLLYKRPRSSVLCQIVVYNQAVRLTAKPSSSVHVRWLPVCDLFRNFSLDFTFVSPLHATSFSVLGKTPFTSPCANCHKSQKTSSHYQFESSTTITHTQKTFKKQSELKYEC